MYIYLIRRTRVPIKPGCQAIGYPAVRLPVEVCARGSQYATRQGDGSIRPLYMRHGPAPSCKFLAKTRNSEKGR
jgi:hypothetical protein